jgi:hypothetical protein
MLQEFSARAAECRQLAQRVRSDHDRELLIQLARAWCGATQIAPKGEARPQH